MLYVKQSGTKKNPKFNLLKLFVFVFGFFAVVFSVNSAVTNITTCSNLSIAGETYQLTSDILNSSVSECMNISAVNVTLDCLGHLIQSDGSSSDGIYNFNGVRTTRNTLIKNCVVSNYFWGIYNENSENNTFQNITINGTSSGTAMIIRTSDYIKLSNILIINGRNNALYFDTSNYDTLNNITIYNCSGRGLYLWWMSNSNISNVLLYTKLHIMSL